MRVEVIVLVHVMVGMVFPFVGPPSYVAQGKLIALFLGYPPSEVVSLVGGWTC